jgi:hypothetical protein
MKSLFPYILLTFLSYFVTQVVILGLFVLRILTDRVGLSGWAVFTRVFVSIITGLIIYGVAHAFKLKHTKKIALFIGILWLLFFQFGYLFMGK